MRVRPRFWVELASAVVSGAVFMLTLIWRDWIELVSGRDPDHHSGSLEWAVVMAAFLLAVSLAVAARAEWRHRWPAATVGEALR